MDNIDIIFASTFKVAGNAIKKLCNSAQVKCYTLVDNSENDFIFDDLRPKLFICSEDYFLAFGEGLLARLSSINTIKILCSDSDHEQFDINWPKKIDTFNFVENIQDLLKEEVSDG